MILKNYYLCFCGGRSLETKYYLWVEGDCGQATKINNFMAEKNLKIYTASAGSGKTFTLTKEYLKLALRNPNYFKHIQAVTFTNKATEEMKERIIKELYKLCTDPDKSDYCDELKSVLSINDSELNNRAKNTLKAILTNYGYLRVKTIDSFFQEVIRSFFRELDIPASFELQLDRNKIIDDAIIRLIYEQKNQKGQTSLQLYAKEQVESGEGHNLVRKLKKLANQLFREDIKKYYTEKGVDAFPSTEKIIKFKRELYLHINTHRDDVRKYVDQFFYLFDKYGVIWDFISYDKAGVFSIFYNLKVDFNANFKKYIIKGEIPKRFDDYINENCHTDILKGVVTAKSEEYKKDVVRNFLTGGALSLMQEFQEKILNTNRLFITRTINTILANIDELGLLSDIKNCIDTINKETNTVLIDNNANLLKQIIDNSDTPFIYEKIGSYIFHYMIDEFQDTSEMQYVNFKPLVQESLATSSFNLVVGDVKQSIYRFRNSDSDLLNSQIKKDFEQYAEPENLADNWRSSLNIIRFNNLLYEILSEDRTNVEKYSDIRSVLNNTSPFSESLPMVFKSIIDYTLDNSSLPETLKNKLSDRTKIIEEYYGSSKQGINDKKKDNIKEGKVVVHQFDDKYSNSEGGILQSLVDTIANLQKEKGIKPSDIAILVRKNKEAQMIVEYLMNPDNTKKHEGVSFNVVSQEALSVSSSVIVQLMINAIKYISRPNYIINKDVLLDSYRIICQDRNVEPKDEDTIIGGVINAGRKTIYSCVESLIDLFSDIIDDSIDIPYLLKFLDISSKTKSNKLMDFDEFVEYWQQEGNREKLVLPKNGNAITLMTIHKSKGLEFKAVLMPMLYSDIIENNAFNPTILWSYSHLKDFGIKDKTLDIIRDFNYPLPISYSDDLGNTAFAEDYFTEMIKKAIDSLNLFYVATTRAKDELHLWLSTKQPWLPSAKSKTGLDDLDEVQTVGDAVCKVIYKVTQRESFEIGSPVIFYTEIEDANKNNTIDENTDKSNKSDECCSSNEFNNSNEDNDIIFMRRICSMPIENRISILREGYNYFEDNNPRRHGNVMHRILSRVISKNDIDIHISKAVIDGLIQSSEAIEVKKEIFDMIETNEVASKWFDPTNRILPEVPIIGGGIQGSRRPDRVVIYPDNTADIIDYKFGHKEDKYKGQVKGYMRHLEKMGYKTRGFLWYLSEGSVIEEVF